MSTFRPISFVTCLVIVLTIAVYCIGKQTLFRSYQGNPGSSAGIASPGPIAQVTDTQFPDMSHPEVLEKNTAQKDPPRGKPTKKTTVTPTSTPQPTATPSPPSVTTTPTQWPSPTLTSSPSPFPFVRSVSTMNQTKDLLLAPRAASEITAFVTKVKMTGATHIGIETPYDSPSGTDALGYTRAWVSDARMQNLKIWHRHMPIHFEGIYGVTKINDPDSYISLIDTYIKNNQDLFSEGDIFTPIPEPENAGVVGLNCESNCMFGSVASFNTWLVHLVTTTKAAFMSIDLGDDSVKVVCCGFNGFVTWGNDNPDWQGQSFLTADTVTALGRISIDHYPVGTGTMSQDLDEFAQKWPGVEVWISESGSIPELLSKGSVEEVTNIILQGVQDHKSFIKGFQWFQLGPANSEALVRDDGDGGFVENVQYDEVKAFFEAK